MVVFFIRVYMLLNTAKGIYSDTMKLGASTTSLNTRSPTVLHSTYAWLRVTPWFSTSQSIIYLAAVLEFSSRSGPWAVVTWKPLLSLRLSGPGLKNCSSFVAFPLTTSKRRVTSIGDSIPVPHTSPWPCEPWQSPHANSAPSTNTGNQAVEPMPRSRISMLPALNEGAMVSCRPASVGVTPIVPQNGAKGTAISFTPKWH